MAGTLNLLIGASLAAAQLSGGNPSLGGGGGGSQGASAPPATPGIDWAGMEHQPNVVGMDTVTDMAYWADDVNNTPNDPNDDILYVFVTGYQTTANGATVFATHKYLAINGPGLVPPVFTTYWPEDPLMAVGTNKAVAMSLDSESGEIYVTGEVFDGVNGFQNYSTIKYDADLNLIWEVQYDSPVHLDDIPAGISFNTGANVVAVTGRSRLVTDDIMTVLYDAIDGSPSILWANNVYGPQGERRWDSGGNETPVGVKVVNIVVESGHVDVAIAGTTFSGNDSDIVTLLYEGPSHIGALTAARIFDHGGDDVATHFGSQIATDSQGSYIDNLSMVFVCGSVEQMTGGDTDFVVLSYFYKIGPIALPVTIPDLPFGDTNERIWGGLAPLSSSDDSAFALDIALNSSLLWVTGRVREADGTGYDIGTIAWDINPLNLPVSPTPDYSWIWDGGVGYDDWGSAIDADDVDVYVAGGSSESQFRAVTMKFNIFQPSGPEWVGYFHGADVTTQARRVIGANVRGAVFMGGSPGILGFGSDQTIVRYKQP